MNIFDNLGQENLRAYIKRMFSSYSLPRWMVFIFDGFNVLLTFIFAYLLRFNFALEMLDFETVLHQSLLVTLVYSGFALIFKPYAGLIRHTTIRDIFNIILVTSSTLAVMLALSIITRRAGWNQVLNIPLSVVLIHFVTINALLFTSRILIQIFYELVYISTNKRTNVIIFGAGSMGQSVQRVIRGDTQSKYNVVAFFDHKKNLQQKNLYGIPVFDPKKLNAQFLEKFNVEIMIFAIRDIPANQKSEIYRTAVDLGLEILEVPSVDTWLNGKFNVDQLKRVELQDLLTRKPIKLNMRRIADGLKDTTILVTGAAGSIGSEIVRQITRFQVAKLILVDNAETQIFNIGRELAGRYHTPSTKLILADITDEVKMEQIFKRYRPEIVFHAAAYKHVPILEENPHEAVRINVGGTLILTSLCKKYSVRNFVMVSTDKAVNPTNVMGASKRICELIVKSQSMLDGNLTQYTITRFGNVLGSNGSVVKVFQEQIARGGPVEVTHPDITRYFMTIPEACQLVLEAGFMGMGGEVYVFEMGDPVRIEDLARRMIILSGYDPEKDIRIKYTGLRPGEKMHEELLTKFEKTLPTHNPNIRIAKLSEVDPEYFFSTISDLLSSYSRMKEKELIERIKQIVPEFTSSKSIPKQLIDHGSIKMNKFPD